ncbi:hypothetical protein C7441_104142 [Pseudaminobacter salicylatoxidans]|uniref:Uncharacterized protein n=1 Tax=Pseudaminobacter salicylatoxidans TaxID=93369 RepID=A0A316CRN6_PSESE|nr:hypothetical protein [Pseudaminobacter salicylatoxidans]PWJ84874.1 hypothetical protein C7441_104142 [Pseudaminobacter salicylatoxidans]
MRLFHAVGMLARRLDVRPSRVKHIASRLQDSGHVSRVEGSRRFPTEIGEPEFVSLFLAVIGEAGIGTATSTAETFGSLTNDAGQRLDRALTNLVYGPSRSIQHLIARQHPPGVSLIVDGQHMVFGADASDAATTARIVPGTTLAAIAAEAQGATPEDADAMAAISKLRI